MKKLLLQTSKIALSIYLMSQVVLGMETSSLSASLPEGFPNELIGYISTFHIKPKDQFYTDGEKNFRLVCKSWKAAADQSETQFYESLNQTNGFLPWTAVVEGAVQTSKTIYRSNALLLDALGYHRTLLWILKNKPDSISLYEPYDFFLSELSFKESLTRFMHFKIFPDKLIDEIRLLLVLFANFDRHIHQSDLLHLHETLEIAKVHLENTATECPLVYHNERIIYYYAHFFYQMVNSNRPQLPPMNEILDSFQPSNTSLGKFLANHDDIINLRDQILDANRMKSEPDLQLLQALWSDPGHSLSDKILYLIHTKEEKHINLMKSLCDSLSFPPQALVIYKNALTYYPDPQMSDLFLRLSLVALATAWTGERSNYKKMIIKTNENFLEKGEWTQFIHWNTIGMIHAGGLFQKSAPDIQHFIKHFITHFLEGHNDNTITRLIELVEGCLIQMDHPFRPEGYKYMMDCISEGIIEPQDAIAILNDLWTKTALGSECIPITLEDIMVKAKAAEDANDLESLVRHLEMALPMCKKEREIIDYYHKLSDAYELLGDEQKAAHYKIKRLEFLLFKNVGLTPEDCDYLTAVYESLGNKDKVAACYRNRAYGALEDDCQPMFVYFMEQAIDISQGRCLTKGDCEILEEIYRDLGLHKAAECSRNRAYVALTLKNNHKFIFSMEKAISISKGKCLSLDDYNLLANVCERLGYTKKAITYRKKGKNEEFFGFFNFFDDRASKM